MLIKVNLPSSISRLSQDCNFSQHKIVYVVICPSFRGKNTAFIRICEHGLCLCARGIAEFFPISTTARIRLVLTLHTLLGNIYNVRTLKLAKMWKTRCKCNNFNVVSGILKWFWQVTKLVTTLDWNLVF